MCSHKSAASKPWSLGTDELAGLMRRHNLWLRAAYGTENSPMHLVGLVTQPSRPVYLLHLSSFPAHVHQSFLLKESRAHTAMVQTSMSTPADVWPEAVAVGCTAMYPAVYKQSFCLGQKSSLREGVRTAQVEIPVQACIAALIL